MLIKTALALELGHKKGTAVSKYQFGVLLYSLYLKGTYQDQPLTRLKKEKPTRADYTRLVSALENAGVLQRKPSIHPDIFLILGKTPSGVGDVIFSVEPFAYMSHLSAMEWHGLTDRIPKVFFVSTPSPAKWRQFAETRMQKDLGSCYQEYKEEGFPLLRRLNFTSIHGKSIHRYSSDHLGAFKKTQDSVVRVSTIGRTFLDMVKEPDLCGGIYHVLDVYKEHASKYHKLITDEIDRNGTQIDKIRAGYILDESCGLESEVFLKWKKFVQRGGSRKLYSKNEYSSEYSDSWQLSINI